MLEIFHVSDLHFGKSDGQNKKSRALLDGIMRQFPFNESDSRYLVVTGDFTQGGRKKEYDLALQALSPFKDRIFVTPGNHDYGSLLGTNYSARKAEYFDTHFAAPLGFKHPFIGKTVFSCEINNLSDRFLMIGLNSCTKDIFDFAQGEIGKRQRTELDELLNNTDTLIPKLVFLHHIPHKEAALSLIMTLRDRKELMAIVSGKVDALAFGHQGKVIGTEIRGVTRSASFHRPMEVRNLSIRGKRNLTRGLKKCTILDADSSVYEQAFYHIRVENNIVMTTVERVNLIR